MGAVASPYSLTPQELAGMLAQAHMLLHQEKGDSDAGDSMRDLPETRVA
jgi:hypothetical protein